MPCAIWNGNGIVGRARHARHVALHLGIAERVPRLGITDIDAQAVREVGLLLLERFRLVGNLSTFDDALARRAGAVGSGQLGMRTGLGLVILEIPVRRDERLPDAVQVGVAVSQSRCAIGGWKLGAAGRRC